MKKNSLGSLEFFIGGLPARIIYGMDSRDLLRLVDSSERRKRDSRRERLVEVCFIGLASYFEGVYLKRVNKKALRYLEWKDDE